MEKRKLSELSEYELNLLLRCNFNSQATVWTEDISNLTITYQCQKVSPVGIFDMTSIQTFASAITHCQNREVKNNKLLRHVINMQISYLTVIPLGKRQKNFCNAFYSPHYRLCNSMLFYPCTVVRALEFSTRKTVHG